MDGNSSLGDSIGSPSILPGNTYVLFLFNAGVTSDGINPSGLCLTYPAVVRCHNFPPPTNETWGITGGPQGKFLVRDGLVYGFKTLYPQLFGGMLVDANGMPLNQFVSMIQSREKLLPLQFPWIFGIALLLIVPTLFSKRLRRIRESRFAIVLRPFSVPIGYASTIAFCAYFLEAGSFSVITTYNFWLGFLAYATVFSLFVALLAKKREHYRKRIGTEKFGVVSIFVGLSPLIVILVILSQTGATMFEKDFYNIALIDGILVGSVSGAIVGDALHRARSHMLGNSEKPNELLELGKPTNVRLHWNRW